MPVTIGGTRDDDITVDNVDGSFRVDVLDGIFFVAPERGTRTLRLNDEPVTTARRLDDGALIELDRVRVACSAHRHGLDLEVNADSAAGATSPLGADESLMEAGARRDEIEITPIEFRPDAVRGASRLGWPRRTTIALACVLLILAVVGWFAFTARSVDIEITPVPASVSLPGTWLKLQLGDRILLSEGSHRVTAQLKGYFPLDTVIKVGPDPDQTVELALTKLPGKVSLAAEPAVAAAVMLDGKAIGQTPLTVKMVPGKHRIEFSADRYLSLVRQIDVIGKGQAQSLTVKMTPNWAPVALRSKPAGATVFVDGKRHGTTPAELALDSGQHALELRLQGYNAWHKRVTVVANEPQDLGTVELVQADGRVALTSTPSAATVTVDGDYVGHTPVTLELDPGRTHKLQITKAGYEAVIRSLSVKADSGRQLAVELAARFGTVNVRSTPPGAAVWVDGKQAGKTPAALKLKAVGHHIEVRRNGFASVGRELTPTPGFPKSLSLELVALDQRSGSGYPNTVTTSLGQVLQLIPAGTFTMGTPRGSQGRRSNEVLRHVKLDQAFYLGVHEVTNAQFRAYAPKHDSGSFLGQSLNDDGQPVVQVTWGEVAQYLNWLSIKDGLQPVYIQKTGSWVPVRPLRNGYRLPTEAEWAWAARFSGHKKPLVFPWGWKLPPPDRSGNFADVSAAHLLPTTLVTYNDGFKLSAPPGSFPANAVGIDDLGGNVSEWVQDYYQILFSPTSADKPAVDPLGPKTGRFHVIRGANWRSATLTELRLAYRDYGTDARPDLGFRIARNLDQP